MPMVAQENAVEHVMTYDPDATAYRALRHSHSFIERSRKLPEGFPERVTDCAAWLPQQQGSSYMFSLSEYREEIALAARNFIVHIRDLSSITPGSLSVAPYTNIKLPFHTDYGNVLSMFVLRISSRSVNGRPSPSQV
ncbi:hypothetical protein DL95DRAFT_482834 [Leptodontidium sp. 2 PMI_412]|nr:hypothetical protein DL95DRAFT_482834 [Leptodontidium sp. 2 PMI_412]